MNTEEIKVEIGTVESERDQVGVGLGTLLAVVGAAVWIFGLMLLHFLTDWLLGR
jgi:hypothetical protein